MQTTTHRSYARPVWLLNLLSFYLLLLTISCSATTREGALLDDKAFTVLTIPDGNTADAAMERISFSGGNFDNDNCHLWGFGNGAYHAVEAGDSITFTAATTSAKEGTMTWKGTVKGNSLNGTMIWSKTGQSDIAYTFSSDNIETVDLNGGQFEVKFTPGDSSVSEVITFNNGMFESPGCYVYGFAASTYQAYILDGKPHFQSTYKSDKEGTMLFYGVIDGDVISGTQFWTKAGQEDIYYTMTGRKL